MKRFQGILDKLPAPLRHAVIVGLAVFLGVIVQAILVAKGITGVVWRPVFGHAIDTSAVSIATAMLALYVTPLTTQYGLFKTGATPKI